MSGTPIVVPPLIVMNGLSYTGRWEFTVPGSPSITRALCKGLLLYISSYLPWAPFYVFISFFNYIWSSFGSFLSDIPPTTGYKFWFMAADSVFPEMSVLRWVILFVNISWVFLFVNISYNDVFRPHGILNNERFYCKIKRVEIFLFFTYFKQTFVLSVLFLCFLASKALLVTSLAFNPKL